MILTFNHKDYILEHLESIKYLVNTFGECVDIDLIINDDCSKDDTCYLIDQWLKINKGLFRSIETIYNRSNLGTCASVKNLLDRLKADHCKLTAGDDIYSYENIFELSKFKSDVAILSGRALFLHGDNLVFDSLSNILATATQIIYEKDSLLHRLKHFSYNNAPNILYSKECLLHSEVLAHLERFDVVEDWPLQIAIARQFSTFKFELIDRVLVYYRRTQESIFIVANDRFKKDKEKIYNDLIRKEQKLIERIRLGSRKICFKMDNPVANKLFNLDFYLFGLSFLLKIFKIFRKENTLAINIDLHQNHYSEIRLKAIEFRSHFDDLI
jgi:glycosyltransferase involved in cell wall biosynthesis